MERFIDSEGRFIVKLNYKDIEDCIEEYDRYCNQEGDTWDKHWYNYPFSSEFVYIYFGQSTRNDDVNVPDVYICNSHDSALKLYEILKKLEFTSSIDGTTCEVIVDKKNVLVKYTYEDFDL